MNEYLVVAGHAAVHALPVAIDGDDVVRRHLLEPDAGGFHQKAPVAAGQAQGHVACDIITLVLAHEHTARIHQFIPQSIAHPSPPVVAVCRVLYISSTTAVLTARPP
jgi:hypothetical protein